MREQYGAEILDQAMDLGRELGVGVTASGENGFGFAQYNPEDNYVYLNNSFFSDSALSTPIAKELIGGRTARERRKRSCTTRPPTADHPGTAGRRQ